jgi:hypothetical protein
VYSNLNVGNSYSNWTILEYLGRNIYGKHHYKCECICENIRNVEGRSLTKGLSKSCGCLKKKSEEERRRKRKEYKAKYYQDNKEHIYSGQKARKKNIPKKIINDYHLKSKYNTSTEEIEAFYITQKGRCLICNELFGKGKRMVIDHNHNNKILRGLLCHNCNVGLGHFKENIEFLKNAIKYLEANNA